MTTREEVTNEQQQKDSDTIFNHVTSCRLESMEEANRAIMLFYVPDMSVSRAGICHALKRIQKYFDDMKRSDD